MAHYSHVMFTFSAGNEGLSSARITSPGRGFNVLTVGNADARRTTAWGDDVMHPSSSYIDPGTGGDKPEIAAYGTDIYATRKTTPWIGYVGYGTSYAAPLVAGIGGLFMNKRGSDYAEVLPKAAIMVSGMAHNIEGDARMSDKDGAGCAMATAANVGYHTQILRDSDFDVNGYYEVPVDIPLAAGNPKRVVLAYTHPPAAEDALPDVSSYYRTDLDLVAFVNGTQVGFSGYSTRNTFEIIDYTPAANGTMRVKIKRSGTWHPSVWGLRIAVAWASRSTIGTGPDTIVTPVPPNDAYAAAITISNHRGQTTGTNVGATLDGGEPTDNGHQTVWWRWIAPVDGTVTFDTFGSSFDTRLAAYTGLPLVLHAKNDDAESTLQSKIVFNVTAAKEYRIVVGGYNIQQGNITLNWKMRPGNDDFANAFTLNGYNGSTDGFNFEATIEPGEVPLSDKTVWWEWTASHNRREVFNTFGSDFDTRIAVYTGNSLGSLVYVAYNDDSYGTKQSEVAFDAVMGTTYRIVVGGSPTKEGNIKLNWGLAPDNDDFAGAKSLNITPVSAFDNDLVWNVMATTEPNEPSYHGVRSAWWVCTPPVSGRLTVDTLSSDFDTKLAAYTGNSLNALAVVAYNDDYNGTPQSRIEFDVSAGITYRIAGGGWNYVSTGDLRLKWRFRPFNDDFVYAVPISGMSGQAAGHNIGATGEPGEPAWLGNRSVWWRWTAPASGTATFDTFDSDYNTLLAAYTGNAVNALALLASNDDAGNGTQSVITFSATAGTTYAIGVSGGLLDSNGKITLHWNLAVPAPVITTASPLPGGVHGTAYSRALAASGGLTPYSWSLVSGTLPAGLALSAGGVISGTPSSPGTSSFTVRVTGKNGQSSTKAFSLTIASAPAPTITTASPLPGGVHGTAYSRALAASGGLTPYSWSLVSGALPAGLAFSAGGVISGTPSAPGASSFTVRVTGNNGQSSTKAFSLTIAPAPAPTITTASPLPGGTQWSAYSAALAASGGVKPYAWSLAAGTLPSGLTLSAGGVISGIPAMAVTNTFTVRVSGANGQSSTKVFKLAVVNPYAGHLCGEDGEDGAPLTTPGVYNGYLLSSRSFGNGHATTLVGTMSLKITRVSGQLSAKVILQGSSPSFKAKVWGGQDNDGTMRSQLVGRGGEVLDLYVRQNYVWGTASGGVFGVDPINIKAMRNRFAERGDAAVQALLNGYMGYYTLALSRAALAPGSAPLAPAGHGYLTMAVRTAGRVAIAGQLADGTRVSRSSQLLECGDWTGVPFFVPLYLKAGYGSGLLWLDFMNQGDVCSGQDTDAVLRWFKPGGAAGFDMLLTARGGFYNKPPALQLQYEFKPLINKQQAAYSHAGGAAQYVYAPLSTPVAVSGLRLMVSRATAPVLVKDTNGDYYDYTGNNPAGVTLAFASGTGVFKGKFNVYYDFTDLSGKLQHKIVSASYAGVMLMDPVSGTLKKGLGSMQMRLVSDAATGATVTLIYPVEMK